MHYKREMEWDKEEAWRRYVDPGTQTCRKDTKKNDAWAYTYRHTHIC